MGIQTFLTGYGARPVGRCRRTGLARHSRPGLQQRLLRRLVVALMLAAFVPVVSAMTMCQIDCVAKAMTGSQGQAHGHGHEPVPVALQHGSSNHLPCHFAATPIHPSASGDPAVLTIVERRWELLVVHGFASVAWPPPRPRPKAIRS